MNRKLARKMVPQQWLENEDYEVLERLAKAEGLTVNEFVSEMIGALVEAGRDSAAEVCCIQVSARVLRAFEEWTEGGSERAVDMMARIIDNEGTRLDGRMKEQAGAANQDKNKR